MVMHDVVKGWAYQDALPGVSLVADGAACYVLPVSWDRRGYPSALVMLVPDLLVEMFYVH